MTRIKKIWAFSIIELVVTLVIISTVASTAYYAWFVVTTQFVAHRRRSTEINNFYLLTTAWQKDFDRADAIHATLGSRRFIFYFSNTSIRYDVDGKFIIRSENSVKDSFAVGPGLPIVYSLSDSVPLIASITIPVIVNGDSVLLSGEKLYSSQQILSAEINSHE
jgi:hypothetical protein